MSDSGLRRLFEQLETWRHFAAYKLENRIDPMFGLFLPEILEGLVKERSDIHPEVIPEFPFPQCLALLGDEEQVEDTLRSDRIDFAVYCRERNVLFLVELKTDMESVCDKQLKKMASVCAVENIGVEWLKTIVEIAKPKRSQTGKYLHLIHVLHQWGLVGPPEGAAKKQWCSEGRRHGLTAELDDLKESCDNERARGLSLQPVLIQPQAAADGKELVGNKFEQFIVAGFEDIAKILDEHPEDSGAALFAEFLRKWKYGPAEKESWPGMSG